MLKFCETHESKLALRVSEKNLHELMGGRCALQSAANLIAEQVYKQIKLNEGECPICKAVEKKEAKATAADVENSLIEGSTNCLALHFGRLSGMQ